MSADKSRLSDQAIAQAKENLVVTVVCHFYDAVEVVREFLSNPEVYVNYIELGSASEDMYNREYYIVLDESLHLTVMPAWDCIRGEYKWHETDVLYCKCFSDTTLSDKIFAGKVYNYI